MLQVAVRKVPGIRFALLGQFLSASAVTILISMAMLTYWISAKVETSLIQTAADEGALLVDVLISPSLRDLPTSSGLTSEQVAHLDSLVNSTHADQIKVLKVWLRDGTLVYSSNRELVGGKFSSPEMEEAFKGKASGSFAVLAGPAHDYERKLKVPLIEVYAPLYLADGSTVFGAAEVYNDGERLTGAVQSVRIATAGIAAVVTAPMMLTLFVIVRRTSESVRKDRLALTTRIREASTVATSNKEARKASDDARLKSIQSNEHLLGQIGQDLHDGPIQLLAILALKQSELLDQSPGTELGDRVRHSANLKRLTDEILTDLSNIAAGLVLPELNDLSAEATLRLAVHRHQGVTATAVQTDIRCLPTELPLVHRICLFRIVQEGLNNAYWYAHGRGQHVIASADRTSLTVIVKDDGPDSKPASAPDHIRRRTGLGLSGLNKRINALGGSMSIQSRAGGGTKLVATLPIEA